MSPTRKQKPSTSAKTRNPDRPRFSTYLPIELVTKLRRAAVEKNWTLTDVIEEALSQYVAREERKLGRPLRPIKRLHPGRPLREH